MNLFFKIFLWFLAAIVLMIGTMVFLNWTVQTEPIVGRWRISVRNQTNIFADTAAQIYEEQGETGMVMFLDRLRGAETIREVDVIGDSRSWLSKGVTIDEYGDLLAAARAGSEVEIASSQNETALSARQVSLKNDENAVMIVRWERPKFTPFFGEPPLRYLRFGALFLAALLLCWALARYLSSPIRKIRLATQKLAAGELSTRLAGEVTRRGDELAKLAADFDNMAERIESLITSQQRLTQDISHELRSPLARMNVALEIGRQKATPETEQVLARIEKESARLNEMISRILILAKLESGADDLEHEWIDLSELVQEIAADAEFEAKAKGKSVSVQRVDQCTVIGSENLLGSAIENIVRNAIRYTKEGTRVDISLESAAGFASLKVSDHGGGVPVEELENLFRPFYRVGEARERETGGIGLGLAIAQRAVQAHKGTITASNQNGGLQVEIKLRTVERAEPQNA